MEALGFRCGRGPALALRTRGPPAPREGGSEALSGRSDAPGEWLALYLLNRTVFEEALLPAASQARTCAL